MAIKFQILLIMLAISIYCHGFYAGKQTNITQIHESLNYYHRMSWKIINEIKNMADYDICVELGGLPQSCSVILPDYHRTSNN